MNHYRSCNSLARKNIVWAKLESGMATLTVAVAILIIAFLGILTTEYLSIPSQLSRTQNYADLAAISGAQLIQNGAELTQICSRVKTLVSADAEQSVKISSCKIMEEDVLIKAEYQQLLPFLTRRITADSRAGPVEK
ncbi:secretion/DNA translocation related TadE-like protein [Arcanobacterium hippocoleae]|uniref:Secretion/DNA translocation related TadE-like protein n=1 Tax=Arcanobacterium hippocoleae TaxID=149017 RepID=A0ABU1T2K5_9ACTO|nr:Rv3654c family TadE-like protein [Arcanobacterium hippocoleae]MDR6939485.1 secretion/DNA translocation related TadE-like protein [Arcanobacterium hippocoleae]